MFCFFNSTYLKKNTTLFHIKSWQSVDCEIKTNLRKDYYL